MTKTEITYQVVWMHSDESTEYPGVDATSARFSRRWDEYDQWRIADESRTLESQWLRERPNAFHQGRRS
jgi:hypothetical protein